VAIVTGADSDLVVIDVDTDRGGMKSMEAAVNRLGPLPPHPKVRTGGGGLHLLFQHPGGHAANRVAIDAGIDLRADGGYIVAPPSIHVSGRRYEWLVRPQNVAPPTIPGPWLDWLTACPLTSQRPDSVLLLHRDTEDILRGLWGSAASLPVDEFVEVAIRETLPTGPGQRHDAVFEFARALHVHPELTELPVQKLRPSVQQWHAQALPFIRTKPFFDTWADFTEGWPKVRFPKGTSSMNEILKRAVEAEPPTVAANYEQPEVRLLIAICRELQRNKGKRSFYLAARTAGDLVGVTPRHALTWLHGLIADGALRLSKRGGYRSKKAHRYRYVGGD